MARITYFVACLALYFVQNPIKCDVWGDISAKLDTNIDVKLVNNKTKVLAEIPAVVSIGVQSKNSTNNTPTPAPQNIVTISVKNATQAKQEIPKFVSFQPRIVASTTNTAAKTITYKLGKRLPGDHVIASNSQTQQWTAAQNVTQSLTYPKTGVGAVITYVEIIVDQSQNLGKAFVTSGGIGQRSISLTIEAYKTLIFRGNAQIFGY